MIPTKKGKRALYLEKGDVLQSIKSRWKCFFNMTLSIILMKWCDQVCSCNKCDTGVYEQIGYMKVDQEKGVSEIIYTRYVNDDAAIVVSICSRCGDIQIKAGKAVLSILKEMIRQQYELPSPC